MLSSPGKIGETVPANRIGCPGVRVGKAGEFMRQFQDGVHPVPFIESSFTVEDFPLRTEVGVQYFVILQIHVGKVGEHLRVPLVVAKYRLGDSVKLQIMFVEGHSLVGSQADIELTERFVATEFKRFQTEYDKPDSFPVRGTMIDARIECRYWRFDAERLAYDCQFIVYPNVGGAGILFPCVMDCRPEYTWEGTTDWIWESDLGQAIGLTPEERYPLERRLAALLMELIEADASIEDQGWECARFRRYRASVKAGETGAEGQGASDRADAGNSEEGVL